MSTNLESKSKRQRASSAKPSQSRSRPASGHSHRNFQKVDFIENLYAGFNKKPKASSKLGQGFGDDYELNHTFTRKYKEA